ncbi:hypothetical protein EV13_2150 [Prochlorococcus sp. MIT 0702]|nr:hypothetical protein EV12_1880 [Prochlorococcus sp. MIT 0701]KGG27338.1 hypothetical protein EV13_2150 [Prochlorococcus sp. MIT 0702]KGG36214.1 hypothetical protein EV14_0624 [Prochlorococcus sp. MIT 0703]
MIQKGIVKANTENSNRVNDAFYSYRHCSKGMRSCDQLPLA